jgi:APA family basic amino acid/polyamine antiporter
LGLVLGYTSSCAFYIASLSSYFYEFILETPFEALSGITMLVGLTLLNIKGTKESGNFQIIVTLGKVLLLIWFVFGGLGSIRVDDMIAKFSTDILDIGSTAALVFITFFGFSAIAASAGEVKNPVKTIPRAIFISMGIVTVLYILVVLVVVAAGLNEYTEAAMGKAAEQFLGPIGGMVIIAGAIFSMVSASNASIMAGSRVVMAMSQLRHFPEAFGAISHRTRTPIVSIMLVGGTIMIFALVLPLEDLAHFADTVLLLVLILVNVALIVHRRKYPNIERPFKVPLVPLLPILGILANLYLLSQILHHTAPVLLAITALVLGVLGYLAWKGTQAEEDAIAGAPSKVALGRYSVDDSKFKILVPLANPRTVEPLIRMACAIAADRKGEVIALRVAVVPEQASLTNNDYYIEKEQHILEIAHDTAQKLNVPVTTLLRIGHNTARAILETSRERKCDLILMGWKGYSTNADRILGRVSDAVVTNARTDLMLVKLTQDASAQKYLLPTAGGPHAQRASEYIASVVRQRGGSLTLCSVVDPAAKEEKLNEIHQSLDEDIAELKRQNGLEVDKKLVASESITDGIIDEAEDYDAVVIGATGYGLYQRILFGNMPETIAKGAQKPVILVKHYHPVKSLIGRIMGE